MKNHNSESINNVVKENNSESFLCVGTTADGVRVYDRFNSHIHMEGGMTDELLSEALSKVTAADDTFIKATIDFGHVVGKTTCVKVDPEVDEIVYVQRENRPGLTPMVKHREPEDCNCVTVVLIRHGINLKLLTAFIGDGSEKEPWDLSIKTEEELTACKKFWSTHALVMNKTE